MGRGSIGQRYADLLARGPLKGQHVNGRDFVWEVRKLHVTESRHGFGGDVHSFYVTAATRDGFRIHSSRRGETVFRVPDRIRSSAPTFKKKKGALSRSRHDVVGLTSN